MNRFDIINRIGDKYRVGNTETGEFSYAQALKTVGKDIKDYQKATTGTQHKFRLMKNSIQMASMKNCVASLLVLVFLPSKTGLFTRM